MEGEEGWRSWRKGWSAGGSIVAGLRKVVGACAGKEPQAAQATLLQELGVTERSASRAALRLMCSYYCSREDSCKGVRQVGWHSWVFLPRRQLTTFVRLMFNFCCTFGKTWPRISRAPGLSTHCASDRHDRSIECDLCCLCTWRAWG